MKAKLNIWRLWKGTKGWCQTKKGYIQANKETGWRDIAKITLQYKIFFICNASFRGFCMLGLPLFSVLPFFIKGWWVSWEMAALSVPSLRSPQATFWKFSDQDYHLQKAWKWKSLLKKLGLSFFSDLYTDVGRVNPSEKVQISIVFWIH